MLGAALAGTLLPVTLASPASATPPNIPSKSTAQAELNALTVATEGSMTGYSRDLFPHWITISGTCNTRETVLKRDGSGVVVDSACYPTSGSWYSPYDGATWTIPSDVDIDHVVPLAEAWRSGANTWTTTKRQSFANDLNYPQLIAVTDNVNQSKGDQDPAAWQPPLASYDCTYSKMWIRSKYHWGLKLQSSEKTALQSMLNTCRPELTGCRRRVARCRRHPVSHLSRQGKDVIGRLSLVFMTAGRPDECIPVPPSFPREDPAVWNRCPCRARRAAAGRLR